MTGKVAILGCGPAGMLAAHAASMLHIPYKVFALKQPSVISGAQFLHAAIPGLDMGAPAKVEIRKVGDAEGYALKVYGDVGAPCSFGAYEEGDIEAWPMAGTYETLWGLYQDAVQDMRLYAADMKPLLREYKLVISTIPRISLCLHPAQHQFDSQPVFFRDDGKPWDKAANFIIYNGDPEQAWYRASHLFGHASKEYSLASAAEVMTPDMRQGIKPLTNKCTCHEGAVFVGRFGKWEKGVLVHHAFQEAFDALQQL